MIEKEMKQFYDRLQLPSGLIGRTIAAAKQKAERRSLVLKRISAAAAMLAIAFLGGFAGARLTRRPPTDVVFPASTTALSAATPSEATPSEAIATPSEAIGTPSEPIVTTAFAVRADQSTDTPFGGTLQWPSFDGIPLGTNMQYVLLYEGYCRNNTPVLMWGDGTASVDEYVAATDSTEMQFRIGQTEIGGIPCSVYFEFCDNTLVCAWLQGESADGNAAFDWASTVDHDFRQLYGTAYGMNDEDEADDIAEYIRRPRFWRLLSVNDPYRFDYQITEKTTQRFIARESLDPLVTLRVQEEDGKYTLSAGIQMTYMCRSADEILDSFRFADVAPSNLLELKEMLGEYGDTVCDIRYLDSRYYQKCNKVEY